MNHIRGILLSRAADLRSAPASQAPPSPCNSVCRMDPASGWCQGCFRSLEEIAGWSAMDDTGKRAVWHAIEQRALAKGDR